MMCNILKYLFSLMIATTILFCSKKESNSSELLVAKVGNEKISIKDFETSFLLNPQYSIKTPLSIARRNQVNFLIDEKYFYLAADQLGLMEDPTIKKRIDYIKDQEVLREYINHEFIAKTEITDEEIKRGVDKIKMQINAINYFFTDFKSASDFRKKLVDFQQSNQSSINSELNDIFNEGTDLGWITFGDLESDIENELYLLKKGEISNIVNSKYGYHILIVNAIKDNQDIQNIPLNTLTSNISDIIRKRKVNAEIEFVVNKMSNDKKIKVNNRNISILSDYIIGLMENREQKPTILIPPIQNNELNQIELKLEDILDEKIIIYENQQWTTRYFLERLKEMPPFHRPYIGTKRHLIQSILNLIKNDLLLEMAKENGYENNDVALSYYDKYKKEYIAEYFKSLLQAKDFQQDFPEKYNYYKKTLENIKLENRADIMEQNLFLDVSNPDSVLTEAPIPVLLKNKYKW